MMLEDSVRNYQGESKIFWWLDVSMTKVKVFCDSLSYSLSYSLIHSLTHSFTLLLTLLLIHSLTHSLTNSITLLLTLLLTHSLTHPLTYSLTHSLTYSFLLTYYIYRHQNCRLLLHRLAFLTAPSSPRNSIISTRLYLQSISHVFSVVTVTLDRARYPR